MKLYIEEHLDPQFQELGLRLALIAAPPVIMNLSTLQQRRAAIDTYPYADGPLDGIQNQLKLGVLRVWKARSRSK